MTPACRNETATLPRAAWFRVKQMVVKLQRWKCVCAYDGTPFAGWQSQAAGVAIQDVIEKRLAEIFGQPLRIHGSGRTDAGVHARGQVFHFDAAWAHATEKLVAALRHGLPAAIQIKSIAKAPSTFHARFDAKAKRYDYYVHVGDADPFTRPYCWPFFKPLDVAAMQAAAAILRGRHDFRAFTALNGHAAATRRGAPRSHDPHHRGGRRIPLQDGAEPRGRARRGRGGQAHASGRAERAAKSDADRGGADRTGARAFPDESLLLRIGLKGGGQRRNLGQRRPA